LATKKFQIKAIDHSEAFRQTQKILTIENFSQLSIEDTTIYGLFPEFKSKIVFKAAKEAQKKLELLSRDNIENLIREIPDDWNLNQQMRDMFCSFIFCRARYVADTLCSRLFPNESEMLFE